MSLAKSVLVSLTALVLAFGPLSGTASAIPGFHAAYFSESSFLSLSVGQTGQFAVGYTNTGDQSWVKGTTSEATLHTAAPLDNTTDFAAGWASNWTSANIYATQSTDVTAPNAIGFFIYNIVVPANAAAGAHRFYGRPAVASAGFLEDFGYYQDVSVTLAALTITSSSPSSPSLTVTPTISGTGAPASALVTLKEGTNILCTATASVTGTWSCTTSALGTGAHSLVASAPGIADSAAFNYTVGAPSTTTDTTAPSVSGAATSSTASLQVSFSEPMKCATGSAVESIATGTNYTFKTSPGAIAVTETVTASVNSACTQATLILSNALTLNTAYTVTVANVQDTAGNSIGASNSATFTVTDSGAPTASAQVTGAAQVTVTYSKPMNQASSGTGIATLANYKLDSVSCSSLCSSITVTPTTAVVNFTAAPSAGVAHTFDVTGVADAGATLLTPNPTSASLTFNTGSARPTMNAASASTSTKVTVTFSQGMDPTTAQTAGNYVIQGSTGNQYSTISTATCMPSAGSCTSVDLVPNTALTGGSYSVVASGLKDTFNLFINPNPTVKAFSYTLDTSQPQVQGASATQTTLTISFNKAMQHVLTCGGAAGAPTGPAGAQIDRLGDYSITTSTTDGTFFNTQLGASTTAQITSDCTSVIFTWTNPVAGGSYNLRITGPADANGNALNPNPTDRTVTVTDSTPPTITAGARLSATQLRVTYSEAMQGGGTPANSAGNPANYLIDNGSYGVLCATGGTASIEANTALTQFTITCTGANGVWSTNGTVTVKSVKDTAGVTITPDPRAQAF